MQPQPVPYRREQLLALLCPVQNKASGCSATTCSPGKEVADHLKSKSIILCVHVVFWDSLAEVIAETSSNTWVSPFPFLRSVFCEVPAPVFLCSPCSEEKEWRGEIDVGRGKCNREMPDF